MATVEPKTWDGSPATLSGPIAPGEILREIEVDLLTLDYDLLGREHLDPHTVIRYTEFYREGKPLPPIRVVDETDEEIYWVWEGFHRVTAARKANLATLPVLLRPGVKRDALQLSLGANESHGLVRSAADRKMAVVKALEDPEWSTWSLRRIGDLCQCSHEFVRMTREALFAPPRPEPEPEPEIRPSPPPPAPDSEASSTAPDPEIVSECLSTVDNGEPDLEPDLESEPVFEPDPALDAETQYLTALPLSERLTGQPLLTFWEDAKKYRKLHDSEVFASFLRLAAQVLHSQSVSVVGPFHEQVNRLTSLLRDRHPARWKLCAGCAGSGWLGESESECRECKGRGYHVL